MNAAIAPDPWEGRVVEGKYPLLELLGSSGHGPVFRTRLPGANPQPAAIKLMAVTNSDQQLARLRAASQLSHPNLLKIFDFGSCQIRGSNNIFAVMEFAEENLGQVVPGRTLTSDETRQMLVPLLEALDHLHANGFVHGRIQPSNILAVGDTLKLSTDSLSKAGDQALATKPDKFSAPEIANGVLFPVADVWSVGATLVTALMPSGSRNASLIPVPDSIPEPFRAIATRCLKFNPGERCTIAQIKSLLQPKLQAEKPLAAVPVSVEHHAEEPTTQGTRGRTRYVLGIGIVVVLAVLGLWKLRVSETHQSTNQQSAAPSGVASTSNGSPQGGSIPASVTNRVMPNVSQNALHTIHGKIKVAVRVNVNEQGQVTEAKLTTAGSSRYFASKALEAARASKFQPSLIDGQAKPSTWMFRYQFAHNGVDVSPLLVQ